MRIHECGNVAGARIEKNMRKKKRRVMRGAECLAPVVY